MKVVNPCVTQDLKQPQKSFQTGTNPRIFLTYIHHLIEIGTFLENMFCSEKQSVAARALINPETSNDNSVAVANRTPPMMGIRDT